MTLTLKKPKTNPGEGIMERIIIYLAAPLFNIAERCHNQRLARELRENRLHSNFATGGGGQIL